MLWTIHSKATLNQLNDCFDIVVTLTTLPLDQDRRHISFSVRVPVQHLHEGICQDWRMEIGFPLTPGVYRQLETQRLLQTAHYLTMVCNRSQLGAFWTFLEEIGRFMEVPEEMNRAIASLKHTMVRHAADLDQRLVDLRC
ncbi:MAG: hypothetical protein AB1411_15935 [Nitrospirota bacterium]